jgi:hypothetical protein
VTSAVFPLSFPFPAQVSSRGPTSEITLGCREFEVVVLGDKNDRSMSVRARITLLKDKVLERPIIAQGVAVHFVGVGPSVEEATEDAARRAVDFAVTRTDLGREEAYMLLSVIGKLRVRTSPLRSWGRG